MGIKHSSQTLICILLLCVSDFLPALLRACTSAFPLPLISVSLLWWWWAEEEEEEEEAELVVVVPEAALTKVGHGYSPASPVPLETPWMCTLAGSPTGLCSFSISALYSFSIFAHFSFCLSQRRASIMASRSRFLFPPLPRSVGMIFFLRTLIQTSFIVSLLPQKHHIQCWFYFSSTV